MNQDEDRDVIKRRCLSLVCCQICQTIFFSNENPVTVATSEKFTGSFFFEISLTKITAWMVREFAKAEIMMSGIGEKSYWWRHWDGFWSTWTRVVLIVFFPDHSFLGCYTLFGFRSMIGVCHREGQICTFSPKTNSVLDFWRFFFLFFVSFFFPRDFDDARRRYVPCWKRWHSGS